MKRHWTPFEWGRDATLGAFAAKARLGKLTLYAIAIAAAIVAAIFKWGTE